MTVCLCVGGGEGGEGAVLLKCSFPFVRWVFSKGLKVLGRSKVAESSQGK